MAKPCFDWTGRLTHVWWAGQETGWAYFRPLTVALRAAQLAAFALDGEGVPLADFIRGMK